MAQGLRDEFRLRNIIPVHHDYASFTRSKWMSAPIYLIYRWVVATFMSVSLLLDRLYFNRWYSSAFTMWGLVTVTLYFDLSAILCSIQYCSRRRNRSCSVALATTQHPKDDGTLCCDQTQKAERYKEEVQHQLIWLHQLMWVLFNVAAVNSMIVTIGYWGLLHSKYGQKSLVGRISYHNITAHLMNSVLMLLDSMLVPLPVRLLHWVYSNIYGIIYVLATVIAWLESGKTRKFYDFLDYSNKPGLAAITVVLCCFVVQPLVQLFFYALYRFREWLLTKFSRNDQGIVMPESQYVA